VEAAGCPGSEVRKLKYENETSYLLVRHRT
jgi:hypothetical protein